LVNGLSANDGAHGVTRPTYLTPNFMPFNPTLPADNSDLSSAEMRGQLNSLKALIDAQQTQLDAQAALLNQLILPQLNHDDQGAWSVSYIGTLPALWQVWVRSDLNNDWSNPAAYPPANFPATDSGLVPQGSQWCQIKICGSDSSNNTLTPFSNVVSLGSVP